MVMALVNPHPALKVAAPMSPMVDGWMGDDWFHYGAFRQPNFDFFAGQTSARGAGESIVRAAATTTTRTSGAPARPATSPRPHGLDQLPWLAQADRAPGLRRVLAGAGARQDDGRAAADRADDVDPGPVGPGRHVGRDPDLAGGRAEGHGNNDRNYLVMGPWRHSRRELRRRDARAAEVGRRHRAAVPPRRAEAVLRPVPEGRARRKRRHAAGLHLQHRREPLGSLRALAAGVRDRLRGADEAALPHQRTSACRSRAPAAAPAPASFDEYVSDPAKPVPVRAAPGALRRRRHAGATGW